MIFSKNIDFLNLWAVAKTSRSLLIFLLLVMANSFSFDSLLAMKLPKEVISKKSTSQKHNNGSLDKLKKIFALTYYEQQDKKTRKINAIKETAEKQAEQKQREQREQALKADASVAIAAYLNNIDTFLTKFTQESAMSADWNFFTAVIPKDENGNQVNTKIYQWQHKDAVRYGIHKDNTFPKKITLQFSSNSEKNVCSFFLTLDTNHHSIQNNFINVIRIQDLISTLLSLFELKNIPLHTTVHNSTSFGIELECNNASYMFLTCLTNKTILKTLFDIANNEDSLGDIFINQGLFDALMNQANGFVKFDAIIAMLANLVDDSLSTTREKVLNRKVLNRHEFKQTLIRFNTWLNALIANNLVTTATKGANWTRLSDFFTEIIGKNTQLSDDLVSFMGMLIKHNIFTDEILIHLKYVASCLIESANHSARSNSIPYLPNLNDVAQLYIMLIEGNIKNSIDNAQKFVEAIGVNKFCNNYKNVFNLLKLLQTRHQILKNIQECPLKKEFSNETTGSTDSTEKKSPNTNAVNSLRSRIINLPQLKLLNIKQQQSKSLEQKTSSIVSPYSCASKCFRANPSPLRLQISNHQHENLFKKLEASSSREKIKAFYTTVQHRTQKKITEQLNQKQDLDNQQAQLDSALIVGKIKLK